VTVEHPCARGVASSASCTVVRLLWAGRGVVASCCGFARAAARAPWTLSHVHLDEVALVVAGGCVVSVDRLCVEVMSVIVRAAVIRWVETGPHPRSFVVGRRRAAVIR